MLKAILLITLLLSFEYSIAQESCESAFSHINTELSESASPQLWFEVKDTLEKLLDGKEHPYASTNYSADKMGIINKEFAKYITDLTEINRLINQTEIPLETYIRLKRSLISNIEQIKYLENNDFALFALYQTVKNFSILEKKVKFPEESEESNSVESKNSDSKKSSKEKEEQEDDIKWEDEFREKYSPENKDLSDQEGANGNSQQPQSQIVILTEVNAPKRVLLYQIFDMINGNETVANPTIRPTLNRSQNGKTKDHLINLGKMAKAGTKIIIPYPPEQWEPLLGEFAGYRITEPRPDEFVLELTEAQSGFLNIKLRNKEFDSYKNIDLTPYKQETSIDKKLWPKQIIDFMSKREGKVSMESVAELEYFFQEGAGFLYYSRGDLVDSKQLAELNKSYNLLIKKFPKSVAMAKLRHFNCDGASMAAATLLRDFWGVPARIVGGYTIKEDMKEYRSNNYYYSKNDVLHAWVQVWDGAKWINFDFTPKNNNPQMESNSSGSSSSRSENSDQKSEKSQEQENASRNNKQNNEIKDIEDNKQKEKNNDEKNENQESSQEGQDSQKNSESTPESESTASQSSKSENQSENQSERIEKQRTAESSQKVLDKDYTEESKEKQDEQKAEEASQKTSSDEKQHKEQDQDSKDKTGEDIKPDSSEKSSDSSESSESKSQEKNSESSDSSSHKSDSDKSKQNDKTKNKEHETQKSDKKKQNDDDLRDIDTSKLLIDEDVSNSNQFNDHNKFYKNFYNSLRITLLENLINNGNRDEEFKKFEKLLEVTENIHTRPYLKENFRWADQVRTWLTHRVDAPLRKSLSMISMSFSQKQYREAYLDLYALNNLIQSLAQHRKLSSEENSFAMNIQKILNKMHSIRHEDSEAYDFVSNLKKALPGDISHEWMKSVFGQDVDKLGSLALNSFAQKAKAGGLGSLLRMAALNEYTDLILNTDVEPNYKMQDTIYKSPVLEKKQDVVISDSISEFDRWIIDLQPGQDLFYNFFQGKQFAIGSKEKIMAPDPKEPLEREIDVVYLDFSTSMKGDRMTTLLSLLMSIVDKSLSKRDALGQPLAEVHIYPFTNEVHTKSDFAYIIKTREDALKLINDLANYIPKHGGTTEITQVLLHFYDLVSLSVSRSEKEFQKFKKANAIVISDGESNIQVEAVKKASQKLPKDMQAIINFIGVGGKNPDLTDIANATNPDNTKTIARTMTDQMISDIIEQSNNPKFNPKAFALAEGEKLDIEFNMMLRELNSQNINYSVPLDISSSLKIFRELKLDNTTDKEIENKTAVNHFLLLIGKLINTELEKEKKVIIVNSILENYEAFTGRSLKSLSYKEEAMFKSLREWLEK